MIYYAELESTFSSFFGEENVDFQYNEDKDSVKLTELAVIVKILPYTLVDDHGNTCDFSDIFLQFIFLRREDDPLATFRVHSLFNMTRTRLDGYEAAWGGYHPHAVSPNNLIEPKWVSMCEGTMLRNAREKFNDSMDAFSLIAYLHIVRAFLNAENNAGGPYRRIANLIAYRNQSCSDTLSTSIVYGSPNLIYNTDLKVAIAVWEQYVSSKDANVFDELFKDHGRTIILTVLSETIKSLFDRSKPDSFDGVDQNFIKKELSNLKIKDVFELSIDFQTKKPTITIVNSKKLVLLLIMSLWFKLLNSAIETRTTFNSNSINDLRHIVQIRDYELSDRFNTIFGKILLNNYHEGKNLIPRSTYRSVYKEPLSPILIPHIFSFKGEPQTYEIYKYSSKSTKVDKKSSEVTYPTDTYEYVMCDLNERSIGLIEIELTNKCLQFARIHHKPKLYNEQN